MQVSKEQFNKAVANFQRAPMQQLKQAGITIKLSEEQKKNVQQKMTARDNPIELL